MVDKGFFVHEGHNYNIICNKLCAIFLKRNLINNNSLITKKDKERNMILYIFFYYQRRFNKYKSYVDVNIFQSNFSYFIRTTDNLILLYT